MERRTKRIFQTLFLLGLIATFSLLLALPAVVEENPGITDLAADSAPRPDKNPRLSSALQGLVKAYVLSGREGAEQFASKRKILLEGDLVQVVAEAAYEELGLAAETAAILVRNQVLVLGGRFETSHRHLVQARIPLSSVAALSESPAVARVRLPLRPVLCAVTSEGVQRTGADRWHNLDAYRTTREVKVAILDLGFMGYSTLLGTELPDSVVTRSFRWDNNIYAGEVHGTACAEIVHDMAPDAKLYLVNFDTDVENHNAVTYLINQGVDVISYSIGWYNIGAGDGTGPLCEDVQRAADNGIVWASAAGNAAGDHWEGTFSDPDVDGWNNFSGPDEILDFFVPAYEIVGAFLNWNDWGSWNGSSYSGSNQDYDLYLYFKDGSTWYLVDTSTDVQNGSQWPTEGIGYWYADVDATWGVAIRKASATKNVKLELFTMGNWGGIDYYVPEGSLVIPADSEDAMAAGATDAFTDAYHSYSSRGPTSDMRIKPDFGAPSGVSTQTYGYVDFYGTSASTPHVAGAFALLLGKTPFSVDQIMEMLVARAVDLGPAGKDNQYGYGRLDLRR